MKDSIDLRDFPIAQHWQDFIKVNQDEAELTKRLNDKCLEDLFTLIYTSGTTGEPKGVMLDYANLAHQLQAHNKALPHIDENDISLSFLPLSHIFERAWVTYVLYRGAVNCYLEDPQQIRQALSTVRPTLMCAVPRFYEKSILRCGIKSNKHRYIAERYLNGQSVPPKTICLVKNQPFSTACSTLWQINWC